MDVELRKHGEVVVVDLKGKLVRGTGDEVLRQVIDQLVASGWAKILLNLSEVAAVDSSGIGELVGGKKLAERFGSRLELLELPDRVRHTLQLSMILPLFAVHESEDEALASLAGG